MLNSINGSISIIINNLINYYCIQSHNEYKYKYKYK